LDDYERLKTILAVLRQHRTVPYALIAVTCSREMAEELNHVGTSLIKVFYKPAL